MFWLLLAGTSIKASCLMWFCGMFSGNHALIKCMYFDTPNIFYFMFCIIHWSPIHKIKLQGQYIIYMFEPRTPKNIFQRGWNLLLCRQELCSKLCPSSNFFNLFIFFVYPNSLIIILRSNYLHIWVYKMRGDYELFLYFFFQKILVSFIVYKPHWSNDINICIFLFYHLQFCVVCLFLSIAIMPYIAKRKNKRIAINVNSFHYG